MKSKFLPLLGALLLATSANAALVDFDSNYSVTYTNYTNPANSIFEANSQGFSFGAKSPQPQEPYAFRLENSASSSGNYMVGLSPDGGHSIDIWREDGQLFSLTSLDLGGVWQGGDSCFEYWCTYTTSLAIRGYDTAGTLINTLTAPASGSLNLNDPASWQTVYFDSSWTNLAYVTVGAQYTYRREEFGFSPLQPDPNFASPSLDNVNVSVVPLPAAIWLFASALGLMGWRSRRH